MHREPDVGFDPGSLGSRPGPKAGAKPLRHPGIPSLIILNARTLLGFVGGQGSPGTEPLNPQEDKVLQIGELEEDLDCP